MRRAVMATVGALLSIVTASCKKDPPAELTAPDAAATVPDAGKDAALVLDPTTRAKSFAKSLGLHDFPAATEGFTEELSKKLTPTRLAFTWQGQTAPLGKFKSVGDDAVVDTKGSALEVELNVTFEHGTAVLFVFFDEKKEKIARFQLKGVPAAYVPPAYVDMTKFKNEPIAVGAETSRLPGVISVPAGKGPFPAILLVQDSGEADVDETTGPSRPFRDLAEGLATRGLVVLRYEKRTRGHLQDVGVKPSELTIKAEYLDDVEAALKLLEARKDVDRQHVFLLGHGLGGGLAPRLALAHPSLAGIITLAGNARPLPDLIPPQLEFLSRGGKFDTAAQARFEAEKEKASLAKSDALTPATPASSLPLGLPPTYWISMRGYDPAATAKTLKQPILVLQGSRDYQVTQADFELWKAALAGRPAEFKLYESLNHAFFAGDGILTTEEYEKLGHVAAIVIDDITAWLKKH